MSKQANERQQGKDVTDKQFIGMKELHQNLKDIADAVQEGKTFTVMRHNEPMFDIQPLNLKQGASRADEIYRGKKKYSLEDLKKFQFDSGEGDLSQRVDEIVYDL